MDPNQRNRNQQNPDSVDQEQNHRDRRSVEVIPPSDRDRRMGGRSATAEDRRDPMSRNDAAAQQSWSGGDERRRSRGWP
jgi:hypothetical protein